MTARDRRSPHSIRLDQVIDIHSTREAIWLWLYFSRRRQGSLKPESCNGDSMMQVLSDHVEGISPDRIKGIRQEKDRLMVPDHYIEWIKDEHRQLTYLERSRLAPSLQDLPRLTGRTRLIAELDHWEEDLLEKKILLSRTRREWEKQEPLADECGWLKAGKESTHKVQYAIRWIEQNRSKLGVRMRITAGSTTLEDLLISFDRANLRPLEVRNIIQSIRASWNKQKYRERNTEKRQMNVMLLETAIEALDDLAEAHGLKRAEIIEHLVTSETEHRLYLAPKKI